MANPDLAALAQKFSLVPDGNEDPNALFPQELRVRFTDGRTETHPIAHTLGSPENPLTGAKSDAKYSLARELAPASADPRIFDNPLQYFTDPQ